MLNPLIDAIFIAISDQQIHKVHTIGHAINVNEILPKLDEEPYKDLFKKNFLIMNALFQLQQELINEGFYLHVSSMHIQLSEHKKNTPIGKDTLRDYYLNWANYETSKQEIVELLDSFWQRLNTLKPMTHTPIDKIKALCSKWQLSYPYDVRQLKTCWRQYAVTHHPDKASGCAEHFKQLKNEYELLKAHIMTLS
ncbi:molecular chaperone DnaJ [Pseudoalteromonas sp. A25]|uniref:DNA-J related domain-containing protein n=1 Tax=Pseudoalteromonas sp. A25 TaxID=116092 RepID=UPI001260D189|nr:DNA-J related domain-containing protein [Pseudoalteromonas sp. A25]BBN80101.1 molecular chaperone DnaJ [Pseudoalteromonas sp. A25]